MPMIDWEDRDNEGREMLLRYVEGRDPWTAERNDPPPDRVMPIAFAIAEAALFGVLILSRFR